jgi:hypothetical protein
MKNTSVLGNVVPSRVLGRVWRVSFSLMSGSLLAAAIWALPATAAGGAATASAEPASPSAAAIQQSIKLQAVSGKVSSTRDGSFTLEVRQDTPTPGLSFQERRRNTMIFFIDSNTTVDGKLTVGALADVTFRMENGNNMAVSVHVAP